MKIVRIFAEKLFSFHYEGEHSNELHRLMDLWNDTAYLDNFIHEHESDIPPHENKDELAFHLIDCANSIDDELDDISNCTSRRLEEFFAQLNNQEPSYVLLSKQKGRNNYLRLYAIKVDENCFVITGGAIKFHHLMEDRQHTQSELMKLDKCRDYLNDNGIVNNESFYEFLKDEL